MVCDKCVVGGGGRTEEEEARDTESKTRTPHKVVGKKNHALDTLLVCFSVSPKLKFFFQWMSQKRFVTPNLFACIIASFHHIQFALAQRHGDQSEHFSKAQNHLVPKHAVW